MTEDALQVCEAFAVLAALGIALSIKPLNQHEGCWEHQVDEQWWIAINGHQDTQKCSKGVEVQPFHCYVQYNGWPAGLFSPAGGTIAAGECANENTFIEALQAAIERATK